MIATRTLTNAASGPLALPDGTVLANRTLVFTLVSPTGFAIVVHDATSNEPAPSPVRVTAGATGLFSVDLFCNDRGDRPSLYSCTVEGAPDAAPVLGSVDEGVGPLCWPAFTRLDAVNVERRCGALGSCAWALGPLT